MRRIISPCPYHPESSGLLFFKLILYSKILNKSNFIRFFFKFNSVLGFSWLSCSFELLGSFSEDDCFPTFKFILRRYLAKSAVQPDIVIVLCDIFNSVFQDNQTMTMTIRSAIPPSTLTAKYAVHSPGQRAPSPLAVPNPHPDSFP